MNLNLGIGALDIPIARKLDISGASERSLQAPVRPAQRPGRASPGSRAGRPGSARAPPSDASALPGTGAGWNDRRPDGTMESGWSGGRARWDDGIITGPRQPRPPVRLPIRPSGPAQWRGAADAQLRRLAGPQNRILTRNTRPAN